MYTTGKIYKIISNETDKVYIGSTIQKLNMRIVQHRKDYRKYINNEYHYVSSFDILQYPDAKIILIETYSCDDKEQLRAREQYYIETTINCANKNYAYIADKSQEWHNRNKERTAEINKESYERNKERRKADEELQQRLKEKAKEIVECECGTKVTQGCLSKHKKSPKHYQIMNNIVIEKPTVIVCECGMEVQRKLERHKLTEKHKQRMNKDTNLMIECECGSLIDKRTMWKHLKSNKHNDFIKEKAN